MSHKQLTDLELDALVVRSLARLPSYAPRRGFGARVMARVRLPEPRTLVLARRARAWMSEPRRALVLAASYAAAAVVGLGIAVPWLLSHASAIQLALDWTVRGGLGVVRQASAAFAGWAVSSGLADRAQSITLSSPLVVASIAALTTGYAGCAVGLHLLLRAPRGHDAPVSLAA